VNLFNEYGVLVHQPSMDLSDQIHKLVSQHCKQLIAQGCTLTDIRALGSYFTGDIAISENVLIQSSKLRKLLQSQEVLRLTDNA
jgi:hypothetical protein